MTMSKAKSNNPLAILDSMRNGVVVRQRLQWMEDHLWWAGALNRSDLMLRFGISPPQATNDFSLYQKMAPANIQYDSKKKLYICSNDFAPLFPKNHERWLRENMLEDQALQTIQLVSVTSLKRGIGSTLMQLISRAVRNKTPLRLIYQSMKLAEQEERIVSPHAIVETQVRWHIRAWDEKRESFVDLVPSRIIDATPYSSANWVSQEHDEQWNRIVDVLLIPSRKLTDNQRRIAEADYQMTNGCRILRVRACLVFYQLSAMYLVDAVRYHKGQPQERDLGIAVKNWKELQPLIMEVY
ncbi:WYL domain-containing protein [Vreelandella neptunia]|uniref:WYL domain-containing protein n=1 Tax=Vreelandella neptunia TaxID=115551 RepID=A0ABZ0YIJ0_9GAMM|nr:WYL domain-containing protein [Halomonas neptunia]MDN3562078.1 WYL domain-containing protein [Halomonas neptunia]WQH11781.1 WYL domain-containing protein [Halomonas neptunia]